MILCLLWSWVWISIDLIQFQQSLFSLEKRPASEEDLKTLKDYGLERVSKCSSRNPERVMFLRFFIIPNLFILSVNILDFLLIAVGYK